MPLMTIAVVLIVAGVALWAVNRYIPMAKPLKTILNVVVVGVVCVWLLQVFHVIGSLNSVTVR